MRKRRQIAPEFEEALLRFDPPQIFNTGRPHSSPGDRTPDEAYRGINPLYRAALRPDSRKDQTAA